MRVPAMLKIKPVYLEGDMALRRVTRYPLDRRELPTAKLDIPVAVPKRAGQV